MVPPPGQALCPCAATRADRRPRLVERLEAGLLSGCRLILASVWQRQPAEAATSVRPALVEPVSERELQVPRLLRTTLPQCGIADAHHISVSIVRSHV